MLIYLGADHRGFELKEELKKFVADQGYEVVDLGAAQKDPADDYDDFARAVAKKVGSDPQARGILVCGSGAGMVMVANRFRGVRAALGFSTDQVFDSRNQDDINVLTLASNFTSAEEASSMVKIFLHTPLSGEPRYQRRLDKFSDLGVGPE